MVQKPNVILIMTDQQRADMRKLEGHALDTMPFTDALAKKGAWFDRAYTTAPICCAARISMLTGRYPTATHVRSNWNVEDAYYTKDMFDIFKQAGYATALIGKNHSHVDPDRLDFFRNYGHAGYAGPDATEEQKRFTQYLRTKAKPMDPDPCPFPLEAQSPYGIVSDTIRWLDSADSRPFFAWVSFPEPHNPNQAPEPYYSMFKDWKPGPATTDRDIEAKGFKYIWSHRHTVDTTPDYERCLKAYQHVYPGMIRLIDDQVARLYGYLQQRGLTDNTLIVFTSDHGDFGGEYGMIKKGPGISGLLTHIPMQIAGPGVVSGYLDAHVSLADLFPTLCEAIGEKIPDGVQGRSLWPMLTGRHYPGREFASVYCEQGFGGRHYDESDEEKVDATLDGYKPGQGYDTLNSRTQSGMLRALRMGDWRLVMDMMGNGELYNLRRDRLEVENLYDAPGYETLCAKLTRELLCWCIRTQDPLPLPRKRYTYKNAEHNYWFE